MNLWRLRDFELRHLCYFVAVTEAGNNLSKAAEQLHIAQPPLSQRIKALEKELGVELFDRTTRPLGLTAAGEAFLKEGQLALFHLERAIDLAKRASRGEVGSLTVGIGSAMANSLLPDILKLFRDRFPNVNLVLRELTTDQQIQELRAHRLDVGFENLPNSYDQDADLCFQPLMQESVVIALPEAHPLAAQAEISLQELADEPFVLPSPQNLPFYTQTIRLCTEAGFVPKVAQEATWMITVLGLVAGGVGVSILSGNVQNLQRKGVVYRTIKGKSLTRQIASVCRSVDSSAVLHEFLQVTQEASRQNQVNYIDRPHH